MTVAARRSRIAVLGSINVDLIAQVPRLPRPGETLTGSGFRQAAGGKGANQAVAAARLGAHVAMIGRVGDDAFARQLRQGLADESIDVERVLTTINSPTGLAIIQVDDHGQNSIVVVPGANGQVTTDDVRAASDVIRRADMLLVQLEVPVTAVLTAIEIAKTAGVPVMLDPAPAPTTWPDSLLHVDYVCPNESEAAVLTGQTVDSIESAAQAARRLNELGARHAIVTLGRQGVWVADGRHRDQLVPTFEVPAVDATAAGDAFAAALAVSLTEGNDFESALRWGCAAGALTTTRYGAQPALPRRHEVERLANAGPA